MERGISVERVCSKLGLSQQAFYSWKKKFGDLGVADLGVADLGVADLGVADLRKLRCWKSSTAMRLSE
jgi:transposase-like protein